MTKSEQRVAIEAETDSELFARISIGQYEAMDVLFNRHYSSLCRFGGIYESDSSIIEEKISDVFILLWNKRKSLNKIDNPKSYLYVIARNRLKKQSLFEKNRQSLDDQDNDSLSLIEESFEDEVITREQKEMNQKIILRILNEIPKKSRQIFEMSRIDGFSYKEISNIMGISPRTVENHVAVALKCINNKLKQQSF
ncbi:sigma-70 family RNA polymerase sigma factor [Fulvivirga maritima]|uniref:RNA polymerase sigma factor n=1 Tax=Fulvivirga maritima TaxID=2904247 RepID=UPI001F21198F|nr:sigma-70 family RNA polymerase sigma factor [Fulvivirga maritima]UII25947.1 sigma-70 family RNA polymerase sigma factor [Fulvivirga maritima]